jgi:ABC-type uncharacterized transport system auxiliary subunit
MADPGTVVPPDTGGAPVRLRPVQGTPFLRERIVWRTSDVEYGLYEQRRWSELPASYVQRALENALRRAPGVALTDDVRAPSLRVEVVAFDEVLAPARSASISLVVSLRDAKDRRLFDRLFTAEIRAGDETTAATAVAMGKALDAVAAEVANTVATTLRPAKSRRSS